MNAWVALWQLIFGLISFPIVFIPLPQPGVYVEPSSLVDYFVNGMKCFAGINSQRGDQCSYFYLIFIVFMCFNVTYNILILVVFQRGSSTLAVVASAARLVLSSFGFLVRKKKNIEKLCSSDTRVTLLLVTFIVGTHE